LNFTTKTLAIVIAAGGGPLAIVTEDLPDGAAGSSYGAQLQASGGTSQYTWSLESGSLPNGLTLGSSGGISGTTTQSGTNHFVVRVTDSASTSTTKALTIIIVSSGGGNPAPAFGSFGTTPNGSFEMLVQGTPNRTYRFEASSTLISNSWIQLQVLNSNPTNGVVYFQDNTAQNQSRRFYRAVLLP
jgi:hypothetical protein